MIVIASLAKRDDAFLCSPILEGDFTYRLYGGDPEVCFYHAEAEGEKQDEYDFFHRENN